MGQRCLKNSISAQCFLFSSRFFKSDPLLDKRTISAFRFRDIPLRSRVFVSWEKSCCRVRISVPDCQLKLLFSFYTRTLRLSVSKLSACEAERSLDQWNASIGRCQSGFSQSNGCSDDEMHWLSFSLTKPISRRQNKKNGKHNGMGEVPMFLSSSPRHSYQSSSGRYWKVLDELGAVFSFGSEMLGSHWHNWLTPRQRYSCS